MKKILAFAMVVLMVLTLGACASSSSSSQTKVESITDAISTPDETAGTKEYSDDLRGLCDYMADANCVYALPESTEDEKMTDPVAMEANLIGADEGYKFTYTYEGGTVVVELYSYSDFDSEWYKQAKNEGKITISTEIDNGTFDAVLSDSGKYLMIYSDSKDRTDREAEIIKVFKSFDIK